METVETNDTKGWIIGAIVLVVVIVGGWWMIKHSSTSSTVVGDMSSTTIETIGMTDNMPTTTSGSTMTVTTSASGEKVALVDQRATTSVMIASMHITKASWIAIKDVKGILGAAWFPAGTTSGMVELLRPTVTGGAYQALIYIDDGDKQFDMHKDAMVMDADGSPVAASFVAK